jgi:hypothetical protein
MYKPHSELTIPGNDVKIWRYMSFAKFVWMLQTTSLYFSTRDELLHEDKWEGIYPYRRAELAARDAFQLDEPSPSKREKLAAKAMASLREKLASIGINCWHMSDLESAAMWKVYGDMSQSVAVESTVGRLIEAFNRSTRDVWIGQVEYFPPNAFKPPMHNVLLTPFSKMAWFEYEEELRAIVQFTKHDDAIRDKGHGVPVDIPLATLIDKVHVSPRADKWFMTTVHHELCKYGLTDVSVHGSYMGVEPDY